MKLERCASSALSFITDVSSSRSNAMSKLTELSMLLGNGRGSLLSGLVISGLISALEEV